MFASACAQTPQRSTYRWTQFVQVESQPEPVPAEWVSTPEGKLAHSIRIPNPIPKDSGYRPGMTSQQYFEHLCKSEAGEFIFNTTENVEGFYFARPPTRPSDDDLMDRYKLEAPEIERYFQLMRPNAAERSITFVSGDERTFKFVEESDRQNQHEYIRAFGFKDQVTPHPIQKVTALASQFGLTWRGLRRESDRELGISAGEWIVFELKTKRVLAVLRTIGLSPKANNTPDRIWWLSATQCPGATRILTPAGNGEQLYRFLKKTLNPEKGVK